MKTSLKVLLLYFIGALLAIALLWVLLTPLRYSTGQGWYLLFPPSLFKDFRAVDVDHQAPFRQWEQFGVYDTAKECTAALNERIKLTESLSEKDPIGRGRVVSGRCVASADPRLGEK